MSNAPPLARQPLSTAEKARLTGLLDALAGYLGPPSQWGEVTQLGLFTVQVMAIRHAVNNPLQR